MKKFLLLWLCLIVTKYAAMAVLFSSVPASVVTPTYDRGPMVLTAGVVALLIFLTVRTRMAESKTRHGKAAAQPVAA